MTIYDAPIDPNDVKFIWYYTYKNGKGYIAQDPFAYTSYMRPSDCTNSLDFWLGRVQDEAKEYEAFSSFLYKSPIGVIMLYMIRSGLSCFLCDAGPLSEIESPSESLRAYSFWLGAPVGMED